MFVRSPRVAAIGVAALLVLTAATDWPSGALTSFWAGHAMLTNLFSGVLFVLLGLSIVEQFLRRQNDRRLELITSVASNAAGRGPLGQWRTMWLLANGDEYVADLDFPISLERMDDLRRVIRRNNLPEISQAEVRSGEIPCPNVEDRLLILASDTQWVSIAYDTLREFTFSFRALIARWSMLLASTSQSAEVLRELAAQAQEIADLFIVLRPVAREGRDLLTAEEIAELTARWRKAFSNAVALDEGLAHFSGQAAFAWSAGSRLMLHDVDRKSMETRDLHHKPNAMRLYISRTIDDLPALHDNTEV